VIAEGGEAAPEPPEGEGNRAVENAVMLGFLVVVVAAGIWLLGPMADLRKVQGCAAAHDPPKCRRFGEKIMRSSYSVERDRTQNRMPLFLIALWPPQFRNDRSSGPGAKDAFSETGEAG
jgi:hypothetical protein